MLHNNTKQTGKTEKKGNGNMQTAAAMNKNEDLSLDSLLDPEDEEQPTDLFNSMLHTVNCTHHTPHIAAGFYS